MSYIDRSLGEGERLVARAEFHWWYTFKAILALAVLGIVLIGIAIFLRMMVRKWTTEIAITTHRFVEKTGWLTLSTQEIALPNIEGVKVTQGFWGNLLGYGRIRIEGTGIDAVELPDIANPVEFRRAIETAKEGSGMFRG
ncbi:MAG TPA: PH domain-containing protein [Rhizomicrobium sp.]|nr:PH domain-containing protein [Rhizomicrobium sp.]